VGVVGDVLEQGLDAEPVGAIYLSRDQAFWANTIAVRTPFDPTTIIPQVKDAVHSVDPQQPVDDFQTVEEIRHASMASPRLTAVLLGLFALLALVIAATGISGVIAYSVSQRTHEIGIRMALGAQRSQVLGMVLRQGLSIVAAGLAVGIVLALFASRFMAELLFDTSHRDALTFGAVMVILLVAAVGAAFFPARRAAGVNPTIALRSE
jgi:putative ABC transport system permease protein